MESLNLLIFCLTVLQCHLASASRMSHLAAIVPRKCEDHARWCAKLGRKVSLMRCYRHSFRCCASCRRMQLSIPGCPYGDRQPFCNDIEPADCYSKNYTCCETCHLHDVGAPGCGYGDKNEKNCKGIGVRFSLSTCYFLEDVCCQTCPSLKLNIPDCPYGDRYPWCAMVNSGCSGQLRHDCCERCNQISPLSTTEGSTFPTTTLKSTTLESDVIDQIVIAPADHTVDSKYEVRNVTKSTAYPTLATPAEHPNADNTSRRESLYDLIGSTYKVPQTPRDSRARVEPYHQWTESANIVSTADKSANKGTRSTTSSVLSNGSQRSTTIGANPPNLGHQNDAKSAVAQNMLEVQGISEASRGSENYHQLGYFTAFSLVVAMFF